MPRKPPTNQPNRQVTPKTWSGTDFNYSSAAWIKLRNQKRRLNPLCEECLKRDELVPTEVIDHIKPILEGGEPFDLDNLRSLCNTCHRIKSAKERHKRERK